MWAQDPVLCFSPTPPLGQAVSPSQLCLVRAPDHRLFWSVVGITQAPVCLPLISYPVVQAFPDRVSLVPESTLSLGRCKPSPPSTATISLLLPDTRSQAPGGVWGWARPCHHSLHTVQWAPCSSGGTGRLLPPKSPFPLHPPMGSFIRLGC